MKPFPIITTAVVASLADPIVGFSPAVPSSLSGTPWRPSTRLYSTDDKARIKKAGAGITTQTPGDLCFYDPNEQGLMQGSDTLMDRIQSGEAFTLSGAEKTAASPATPVPEPTPPTTQPEPKAAAPPKSGFTSLRDLLNAQMGSFGGQGGDKSY